MRTSLKAALAGVAGAGLLLGGAGSLAFWEDTDTENGGTVEAGTLNLQDRECTDWLSDPAVTTSTVDLFGSFLVVPGTKVTKNCTFGIEVKGVLDATLTVNDANDDGLGLGPELDVTSEFTILDSAGDPSVADAGALALDGGEWTWSVGEGDNGKTLQAVITVELPFESGVVNNSANSSYLVDDSDALATELDDLTVTVTQTP